DIRDAGTEPLANQLNIAPLTRRRHARRRRRRVLAVQCEHPADEHLGRPSRERDDTAALQHAQHLADRDVRTWREHVAELTYDEVEARAAPEARARGAPAPVRLGAH